MATFTEGDLVEIKPGHIIKAHLPVKFFQPHRYYSTAKRFAQIKVGDVLECKPDGSSFDTSQLAGKYAFFLKHPLSFEYLKGKQGNEKLEIPQDGNRFFCIKLNEKNPKHISFDTVVYQDNDNQFIRQKLPIGQVVQFPSYYCSENESHFSPLSIGLGSVICIVPGMPINLPSGGRQWVGTLADEKTAGEYFVFSTQNPELNSLHWVACRLLEENLVDLKQRILLASGDKNGLSSICSEDITPVREVCLG